MVSYNTNVCKDSSEDVNKDVNEDDIVSENVNDNELINNDFADEICAVRKFPGKGKKDAHRILEHGVKEIVIHILHDIEENVKINGHDVKGVLYPNFLPLDSTSF